ncbi:MAG TPA: glycosyltransferase family 4 protein [Candidatus Binataceae bacterium]|jgi:UDP-glucose:(heptosyl)LPS alpha-1,3-glucosyltransferase|nr:glycosyltransferase family 4 protein [Candidatus Binataceae bacterium]
MRLALIARRFDPAGGGTERDLLVTAEGLLRAGHEVTIYAAEVRKPTRRWRIVQVGTSWLSPSLGLWRFAWAAPAMARRDGADLVISFARAVGADVLRSGGGAHVAYLRAARRWRGRAAASAMHLRPYHRVQMAVERAGFTSPALRLAIAVSKLVRKELIAEFELAPEKVATLYNGVNLERFHPVADRATRVGLRQAFQADTGAPVVAFVGNGFARKGLAPLLKACSAMETRPFLLIAGSDRAAIRYIRLAHRLGIDDRVRFLGAQEQIERVLHASDALALPSFFEPFGNVVMEALASGIGALASAQCGVAELMPPLLQHLVVEDPADSGEIANGLDALVQSGRELGEAARAAAAGYTWERYANGLLALINSLA